MSETYQGKPVVGRPSMAPTNAFFASIEGKELPVSDGYYKVYSFRPGVYSIYVIDLAAPDEEIAGPWLQLIDGEEGAMLIDTGFFYGDLKRIIRALAGEKPLTVVNTHCHLDHTGGNHRFDRVYCCELEEPQLRTMMSAEAMDRQIPRFARDPRFRQEDVIPWRDYELIGCPDHTVFRLGPDHEVELLFLPGHTEGGCAYLDKKNRILFSGDALMAPNQNLGFRGQFHPENMTVTAYHRELKKIIARMGEFDTIFSGHRKFELPKSALTDVFQACEDILADPDCNEVFELMPRGGYCKVHQVGYIGMTYKDEQI